MRGANRAEPSQPVCSMREEYLMLRYITSTLTACALAGTVSVFAQEPAPAQPEKQQAAKETLTGCVLRPKRPTGARPTC